MVEGEMVRPEDDLREVGTGQFKIAPGNVTSGLLRQIVVDAGVEAEIDKDDDVVFAVNGVRAFLSIPEDRLQLRLFCIFAVADGTSLERQYEFANGWNKKYVLVRAAALEGAMVFDHYVVIAEGCTVDHLVASLRRFFTVMKEVAGYDTEDVLA